MMKENGEKGAKKREKEIKKCCEKLKKSIPFL